MSQRHDQPRAYGYDRTTVIVRNSVPPPVEAIAGITRESDRHIVIVAAEPAFTLPELAALLAEHVPVRCRSVRLVLSEAGRPEIARALADRLGLEVVAPSGPVLLLPDGNLFVTQGEWCGYRPGGPAERYGARHPAPAWQRLLPQAARPVPAGVRCTAIPAGLWLHDADSVTVDGVPLNLAVNDGLPMVLVGRPGGKLSPDRARAALEALPRPLRRRMALVPYGIDDQVLAAAVEKLVARAGGVIEMVPLLEDAMAVHTERAAPGGPGFRSVRPFARRLTFQAGMAPQVLSWYRPLGDAPVRDGRQYLDDDWSVEVVRAGLWLRHGDDDAEQDLVRRLVPPPEHLLLVLGAPAIQAVAMLPTLLDRLVGQLPSDAREVLRLTVTRPPADLGAPAWAALVTRYGPLLTPLDPASLVELSPPTTTDRSGPAPEPAPEPAPNPEPQPEFAAVAVPEVGAVPAAVREDEAAPEPVPDFAAVAVPGSSARAMVAAQAGPAAGGAPVAARGHVPAAPARVHLAPRRTVPRAGARRPLRLEPADGVAPLTSVPPVSTADDRWRLRELLGDRYAHYGGQMADVGLGLDALEAAALELVAVEAYLAADPVFTADPVPPSALGCLVAGLQRLPKHRGGLLVAGQVPSGVSEPGREVMTVDVVGAAWPLVEPYPREPLLAVWVSDGRRPAQRGDGPVLFRPGTRFRVLGAEPADADHPLVTLLRELPAELYDHRQGAPEAAGSVHDRRARTSLRRLVAAVRRAPAPVQP